MLSYRLKRTSTAQVRAARRAKPLRPKRQALAEDEAAMGRRIAFRSVSVNKNPENDGEGPTGSAETYVRFRVGQKSFCVRSELYTTEKTRMHDILAATHEQRLKMVDGYDEKTGEYYLERNVPVSEYIFDFFATGTLHKPHASVCLERFKEELTYWKISQEQLAGCCPLSEATPRTVKEKHIFNEDEFIADFDGAWLSEFRRYTWRFLEDPQSSYTAAGFAVISVLFVFASVIGLILGSMPEFQVDPSNSAFYHNMHVKKPGDQGKLQLNEANGNGSFVYKPTDNPNAVLVGLEYLCIAWFTIEYVVRFIVYPRKAKFVRKTLNVIDLMTILPFYLELCLPVIGIESHFKELTGNSIPKRWMGAMLVVRVLRVMRMARLFKLARYSSSLQTFGHTLKSSIPELSMLFMFLVCGIIFFSTIMYYLEKDELHTDFYSIPASCWWCVVTMATVGYGDAKPVTTWGKLVATATSICGIIVLAFPISMIVEKFANAQQKAMEEEQMHQAQMSALANNYLLRRFPTRRKVRRDCVRA